MSGARIPVTVLTGASGAGKTTLLRHMLSAREARNSIVIVSERRAGLDHLLVQQVREDRTFAPEFGCDCCAARTDLGDALSTALWRAELSGMKVERVFVESAARANPVAVVRALATNPYLQVHFRWAGVVTVVDAQAGFREIERDVRAMKQVTAADLLVVTKGDLARSAQSLQALHERLDRLNPFARRVQAEHGALEIDVLLSLERGERAVNIPDVVRVETGAASNRVGVFPARRHTAPYLRLVFPNAPERACDGSVRAFSVTRSEPLKADALTAWLQKLTENRNGELLRLKGVVHVGGEKSPRLVQSLQHFVHEPVVLPAWPSEDRRTRLVFVARGIDARAVERSLGLLSEASRVAGYA